MMNVKINDLMTESVIVTESHKSIDHVRAMMEKNKIGAIPVVDHDGQAVGIVSATDLVPELNGTIEYINCTFLIQVTSKS